MDRFSTWICRTPIAIGLLILLSTSPVKSSGASSSSVAGKGEMFNFDGDYGKQYGTFIRKMIPGYDHFLEMTGDILSAKNDVKSVLVIGPGRGEELVTIALALPDAVITAYEASEEMAKVCQHQCEIHNLSNRVTIYQEPFQVDSDCSDAQYDAVTIFNVLHFLPTEEQGRLLRSAASRLAPGGVLLVSGSSLPPAFNEHHWLFAVTMKRWERLGIDADQRRAIYSSSAKSMFSLVPEKLDEALGDLSMSPLEEVFRGLGSAMWYSYMHQNNE